MIIGGGPSEQRSKSDKCTQSGPMKIMSAGAQFSAAVGVPSISCGVELRLRPSNVKSFHSRYLNPKRRRLLQNRER